MAAFNGSHDKSWSNLWEGENREVRKNVTSPWGNTSEETIAV
jgi:hypothetical protein